MNNEFESVGKRMPYKETPEYISLLASRCAERAISDSLQHKRTSNVRRIWLSVASAAAVIAIVAIIGLSVYSNQDLNATKIADSPNLDQVIKSLSDEQLQELYTYSIDDIPEY